MSDPHGKARAGDKMGSSGDASGITTSNSLSSTSSSSANSAGGAPKGDAALGAGRMQDVEVCGGFGGWLIGYQGMVGVGGGVDSSPSPQGRLLFAVFLSPRRHRPTHCYVAGR